MSRKSNGLKIIFLNVLSVHLFPEVGHNNNDDKFS
jgi:hypothetical protein